jgi:hypothetical protein
MNTIPATIATQAANLKTQGVRCGAASVDAGAGAVAVEVRTGGVSDVSLMRHMMRGSTIVTAMRYLCSSCELKTCFHLARSGLNRIWRSRYRALADGEPGQVGEVVCQQMFGLPSVHRRDDPGLCHRCDLARSVPRLGQRLGGVLPEHPRMRLRDDRRRRGRPPASGSLSEQWPLRGTDTLGSMLPWKEECLMSPHSALKMRATPRGRARERIVQWNMTKLPAPETVATTRFGDVTGGHG